MINKTKEDIDLFFEQLLTECKKEGIYSVIETAEKMGVAYTQVQEWAKSDERLFDLLDFCQMSCKVNADKDGRDGKISALKSLKYQSENDEEFKNDPHIQAGIKELEQEEKKLKQEKENSKLIKIGELIMNNEHSNNAIIETHIEDERVKNWKQQYEKEKLPFNFQLVKSKDEDDKNIHIDTDMDEKLTHNQKTDIMSTVYAKATGSVDPGFSHTLVMQTLNGQFKDHAKAACAANSTLAALTSLKPADPIEGMIISKILVFQNHIMHFANQVSGANNIERQEKYINQIAKLTRLFNESVETLNKYRRKGEQKMTVLHQHIQADNGAQATVNNQINQGG